MAWAVGFDSETHFIRSIMDNSYRRFSAVCNRSVHAVYSDFCAVPPHPDLRQRWKQQLAQARGAVDPAVASALSLERSPRSLGFDDGVIIPPNQFPVGTAMSAIRSAAADRAPLRGSLRVVVVLVQFSDHALATPAAHFQDLFFSTGVLPNGSVKEYFRDVTGGLIDVVGEVVGPYTLPQTLAWYANNNFGIAKPSGTARANVMARDAAAAADPNVNFGLYDNDNNGFVDAFIVVHAGGGGEQTGNPGDIWSHKWTLPSAYAADGKQVYAYLTIPEDARLGVCAHELGHLLFGFPDLYDTDYTSEGIGNWCLMAGGSWNAGGDIPAHPSAWCKANQGWVAVNNVTAPGTLSIPDIKVSRAVHRLWKDGAGGNEYFLLENRQRTGYDAGLPGDGLLIWHIDESQPGNTDENHYKVALVQADGRRDMELDHNRGDGGDPFPGTANNTAFNASSTPNSNSYANQNTCVTVSNISPSGPTMSAKVTVTCKAVHKEVKDTRKDVKEFAKDLKDSRKDGKELKELRKDGKEVTKEFTKEGAKDLKDRVEHKPAKELVERPGGFGRGGDFGGAAPASDADLLQVLSALDMRLSSIEAALGGGAGEGSTASAPALPFIGSDLRPDLIGAGTPGANPAADELQQRMLGGDAAAKRAFDTLP
jgi:immune inhibitor A